MVDVGTAALQIIPSFEGFQGKLESGSAGAFTSAGSSGGRKFGDSAGKSMSASFKSHAKLAAVAAGASLAAAGYALFKFGQDSVAEARESQKVGALTEQVIKSTGSAAHVTAKQVGDLSTAISLKTGIDDEAIQSGSNMLLTFKNLRNEVGKGNDIFNQATQLTTDMAAAMAGGKGGDIDLKSSAIQVGKALGDPVKGVTALAKVGVTFSNQQRAQIKALVEGGDANAAMALGLIDSTTTYNNLLKANGDNAKATADVLTKDLTPAQKKAFDMYTEGGHTLEAQKRILTELKSEFGGAAAAQATMGEKMSVAWGNIKENVGTALLPIVDDLEKAFLKKGVPALTHLADTFQKKGIPAIKHFVDKATPLANSILPAMGDALNVAKDAAGKIAPVLKGVFDGFNKLPDSVKTLLVLSAGGAAVAKKVGAFSVGKSVLGAVASKSSPIPVLVVNDLKGFKEDGALALFKKSPWAISLGLAAIPAVGGAAAAAVTPKDDRNQMAPGSAGYAGDGGLSMPSGGLDFSDSNSKEAYQNLDNMKRQAWDANVSVRTLMASIKTLPGDVITRIALDGAPESKKEAMDLVRQYDLTPQEKKTLFQTYGIYENKRVAQMYQDLLGKTPKEKRTNFGVDGIPKAKNDLLGLSRQLGATAQPRQGSIGINTSAAEANLNRVLNLLNNINRQANMNSDRGLPVPHTPSPRQAAPRTSGPSLSGGGGRQRTSVSVHIGDREFDAYMDERIATHGDMADERKRANR